MWHGLSVVYCVSYNVSCIAVTTEQCDLCSCSVVSHETCVVYNICNSVPRGTTYLARYVLQLPSSLMSVYNYVSGHHVVIFVTLVCTVYTVHCT